MDPEGLYHPGQIGLAQAEQLGGLGLVATRGFQGLTDQSTFVFIHCLCHVLHPTAGLDRLDGASRTGNRSTDLAGKVRFRDLLTAGDNNGPLDDILQLTDIAWPGIRLQQL